jgi:hypothetical protein
VNTAPRRLSAATAALCLFASGAVMSCGGASARKDSGAPADAGDAATEASAAAPDARRDANDAARDAGADAALCTRDSVTALESQMTAILSAATVTPQGGQTSEPAPAFTLFLQRNDGRTYLFNNLDSTPDTSYQSASTSKLVSAAIILSLVDRGVLSLDDHPQKYISWPTGGAASQITLRQLLAFISGLNNDPPTTQTVGTNSYTCLDVPPTYSTYVPWAECVAQILNANFDSSGAVIPGLASQATAPGAAFYYTSNHLQVAGLMALAAAGEMGLTSAKTGAPIASWGDLFADYQTRTGLFGSSLYDLPSATNPRLAGGMHWTVTDYSAFLLALYRNATPAGGAMLSAAARTELFADQRAGASVLSSPVLQALGEDWHYSLGNWIECPLLANATSASCAAAGGNWYSYLGSSRCCTPIDRHTSPGAYGSYPFVDFANRYVGILALMIQDGGFRQGVAIFRELGDLADRWARNDCKATN